MTAIESDRWNEVILAVDGVVDAYPPPSIPRLIGAAAGAEPRAIAPTHDGRRIEARIATTLAGRSADTARAVADAVLADLGLPDATLDGTDAGETEVRIRVQIARIR